MLRIALAREQARRGRPWLQRPRLSHVSRPAPETTWTEGNSTRRARRHRRRRRLARPPPASSRPGATRRRERLRRARRVRDGKARIVGSRHREGRCDDIVRDRPPDSAGRMHTRRALGFLRRRRRACDSAHWVQRILEFHDSLRSCGPWRLRDDSSSLDRRPLAAGIRVAAELLDQVPRRRLLVDRRDADRMQRSIATFGTSGVTRDCSRSDMLCAVTSQTGCTDRAPILCTPGAMDRCDGDIKLGCDDCGFVSYHDCAWNGGTCVQTKSGAKCVPGDQATCPSMNPLCDGPSLSLCVFDSPVTVDCTAIGMAGCRNEPAPDGSVSTVSAFCPDCTRGYCVPPEPDSGATSPADAR